MRSWMRAISGGGKKPVGRSPSARPVARSTGVGEWVGWLMLFRPTRAPALLGMAAAMTYDPIGRAWQTVAASADGDETSRAMPSLKQIGRPARTSTGNR